MPNKNERYTELYFMRKCVLVVDDEADLRELIAFDFDEAGFLVLEAENAKSAMNILENNKVDIVISDIRMPDGDGVTLLEEVKQKFPNHMPAFIFITGYSDITAEEAMKRGASGFFSKPFDRRKLIESVSKLVA